MVWPHLGLAPYHQNPISKLRGHTKDTGIGSAEKTIYPTFIVLRVIRNPIKLLSVP